MCDPRLLRRQHFEGEIKSGCAPLQKKTSFFWAQLLERSKRDKKHRAGYGARGMRGTGYGVRGTGYGVRGAVMVMVKSQSGSGLVYG